MSRDTSKYLKFGSATVVILLAMGYLAYTACRKARATMSPSRNCVAWAIPLIPSGYAWVGMFSPVRSSVRAAKSNLSWWKTINS